MTEELRIHALAKQIADHLPPGWHFSPQESEERFYAVLQSDCHGMHLRITDGRLVVTGAWPMPVQGPKYNHLFDPYNHGHDAPRITCDPDREPDALARDIERRFLPDYARLYDKMVHRRDAKIAELKRLAEVLDLFIEAGATSVDGRKAYLRYRDGDLPSGHAEVAISDGKERAHLDVRSLPLDVALWIVAEIADCRRRLAQAREGEK